MPKRLFFRLPIIMTTFLVIQMMNGCAVATPKISNMEEFKKDSEKGLLVGSITFPSTKPKYTFYFVRLTDEAMPEFKIDRSKPGELDDGKTYLFAIERPVGKSEMSSIRFWDKGIFVAGQMSIYYGGYSIPYEITKGEITYIGNIICNDYATGKETFVSLKNNFEKDITALQKIKSSSEWNNVKNDLARKIEYTNKKAKID